MKKILLIGSVMFTATILSACSPSKTAKQNYIDAYSELSNQFNNDDSQNVTIKFDSFNLEGELPSKEVNKLFDKASINIESNIDYQNKIAEINTETKLSDKDIKFNMLLGKEGVYFDKSQIKFLVDQFSSDNIYVSTYGQIIDQVDKKYLLMDSELMDSGLVSQEGTEDSWGTTYNEIFEETKVISKEEAQKYFQDISEKDFSQSGDQVTMKISGNGEDILNYFKKSMTDVNKNQIDPIIDSLEQYANINSLTIESTLNSKTHKVDGKISGDIQSKEGDMKAKFQISVIAQPKKSKNSITEPSKKATVSMSELMNSLIMNSNQEEDVDI